MCRKYVFLVLPLLYAATVCGQSGKTGSLSFVNVQYKLSKKWFAYFEAQSRSDKLFGGFYYRELKGGLGFKPAKNASFLLGNGSYKTYSVPGNFRKPLVRNEYRLWQQMEIEDNLGRLRLEHRYRVEQRWLSSGFENRFRYRLNGTVALNNVPDKTGALYGYLYDEVFLTDLAPYFLRNRVFAGVGYNASKQLLIQAGYMHQFEYEPGKKSSKGFLQVGMYINLPGASEAQPDHNTSEG